MKKHPFTLFIAITGVFAAFMLGLFIGRNQTKTEISLSVLPTLATHNLPIVENTVPLETEPAPPYPIDINSASEEELDQLPGIGKEIADRIIAFRTTNGPFAAPEELLNVDGIGPGKLEAILDLIITGGNAQ